MRKQITLKGFANCTNYMACENSSNKTFLANFEKLKSELISLGYRELRFFENLRGKNAIDIVTIYAYYWRGAWADATKQKYTTFYR